MRSQPSPTFIEAVPFPDNCIIFPPTASSAPAVNLKQPTSEDRVLVAEDDAVSCQVLATCLRKWGYEPVITRDGNEAMTVMRSGNAPALAVLDWMMPGMDGLEVCRRLRDVNKVVHIIFLSARGARESLFEALQAGADDYLVKPFDPLELQGRIQAGFRIIRLRKELTDQVTKLSERVSELNEPNAQLRMPL
jgi:DNA-binding response OmpR family regulator